MTTFVYVRGVSIHSLLHLDICAAARHNFMLVASLPAVAVLAYAEARRESSPKLYARLNNDTVIWTTFGVFAAWWVLRNVFGW